MKTEHLVFKISLLAAFCQAVWMCGIVCIFGVCIVFIFWVIDWMWRQKQTQGERNIYPKELIFYLFLLLYLYDWNCCRLSSTWGSLLVSWALVVCRHLTILNAFSNWATWQSGLILKMLFRIAKIAIVCCVKKAIKIASSSMFLKPPLQGVHVFELYRREAGFCEVSAACQPLPCCPGSPWGATEFTLLPRHLPVSSGAESSQGLWMCTSLCHGNQEVTWRIPFVCSKRTRNVCGWLKNNKRTGISVYRNLFVTAVIYTAERVHLGSWTGCGLLEWWSDHTFIVHSSQADHCNLKCSYYPWASFPSFNF